MSNICYIAGLTIKKFFIMTNKLTKWQKVFKTTQSSNLMPGTYSYENAKDLTDETANTILEVAEALFMHKEPVPLVDNWKIYDIWADILEETIIFHISIDQEA